VKIGIQTWGTEGDVRPFFALAAELTARGHDAKLVYTSVERREFSALAGSSGVSAREVGGAYFQTNEPRLQGVVNAVFAAKNPFTQARLLIEEMLNPVAEEMFEAAVALAEECDVIVGHFMAHPAATAAIAKKRPFVGVGLQPIFESSHFPPPGAPDLGRLLNPLLWRLARSVLDAALRDSVNALRVRCGLSERRDLMKHAIDDLTLALVAVSPSLLATPPDWRAHVKICGFLALAESAEPWAPDEALRTFLDAGAPPVFGSFGSMFSLDGALTRESVIAIMDACALAATRVVIQAPPAMTEALEPRDDVLFLTRAPHGRLFPLCSAIIHHGGAGTSQSALAAHRPSIIVPHAADQVFWASALCARGAATKPLARRNLTAPRLAERIRDALRNADMRTNATRLGEAIGAENGARRASELIEALAESA
jgi:sterol 3beta-glucosyltransferase